MLTKYRIEPRFAERDANKRLAVMFALPFEENMQDWAYAVADPKSIDLYIDAYKTFDNENDKFVLMEMILQALVDQSEEDLLIKWREIKNILVQDYSIHAYTVNYWSGFTNQEFNNGELLGSLIREFQMEQNQL